MADLKTQIGEIFKNHTAKVICNNDHCVIIDFKEEDKYMKSINVAFMGNHLFITGDYGEAIFKFSGRIDHTFNWEGTDISYFLSKLVASSDPKYTWDNKEVKKTIYQMYKDIIEYKKLTKREKQLLRTLGKIDSEREFQFAIVESESEISKIDQDYWEWLPTCGRVPNFRFELYLEVLKLIHKKFTLSIKNA